MNDKHINEQIKKHYQEQNLTPDRLEKLLLLSTNNKSTIKTKKGILLKHKFVIAASVCLLILITLPISPYNILNNKGLAILVSEEIALNHNKQLSIEFSAKNFFELRKQMKKLDFTPIASSRLDKTGLRFLGARYCSIQGQLAAQIKLVDNNGQIQTLYQTQMNDKLLTLPEKSYVVDGVKITQWQENGLFFGLAATAN